MARQDIVWVIDDDRSIRWVLEKALSQADMTVKSFDSANEIADLLDRQRPDVVVSDIRMPGVSGLELLETIHAKAPEIPVIIITAHTDLESAVASYRGGAFEYLPSHSMSTRRCVWCAALSNTAAGRRWKRRVTIAPRKLSAPRLRCRKSSAPSTAFGLAFERAD